MTDAQPTPAPMRAPADDDPKGIGGWLILPLIQLGGTVVLTMAELLMALTDEQVRGGLSHVFDDTLPTEAQDLVRFAAIDGVLGVVAIVLSIACVIQIIRTKRSVPVWMTAFYVFTFLCYAYEWYGFATIPYADAGQDAAQTGIYAIGAAIRGAIFIAYFWVSKRVKNTFVN